MKAITGKDPEEWVEVTKLKTETVPREMAPGRHGGGGGETSLRYISAIHARNCSDLKFV